MMTAHSTARSIAAARAYVGMTQAELAQELTEATGIEWSNGMVGHLESGRRRAEAETVHAIAQITGLSWEFFLLGPTAATLSDRNSVNPG